MNTIDLVLVLAWTVGVAFACYRIGYSEGHNDATIYSAKQWMEGQIGETSDFAAKEDK